MSILLKGKDEHFMEISQNRQKTYPPKMTWGQFTQNEISCYKATVNRTKKNFSKKKKKYIYIYICIYGVCMLSRVQLCDPMDCSP